MPKLQLSFNATFVLKKEDLIKVLQAAAEEKGLDDTTEGLIQRTGLGNRKVGPMKSWAIRAGLVSNERLSPEGEVIWRLDRSLESVVTDWLMHFYLSFGTQGLERYKGVGEKLEKQPSAPADWGGWSYFVYTFLPEYHTFTLGELVKRSASVFNQEVERRLTENFTIVLKAYALPPNSREGSPLKSCKFLTLEGDQFVAGNAPLPNPYLLGYFLAKLWERDGNTTSVLTDDILQQKMGLSSILGIETETLQECLNQLETLALIEQRRTVSPAQIIRRWDNPLTLLEKAYAD
jgi:hypothetical protein